eukprot:363309-Chlamydomonas_euryale.AAC.10
MPGMRACIHASMQAGALDHSPEHGCCTLPLRTIPAATPTLAASMQLQLPSRKVRVRAPVAAATPRPR